MSKRKKITLLSILVFLFGSVVVYGIGMTMAYYTTTITGAFSGRTSKFDGNVEIVNSTHTIVPASNNAVDTVEFYVKNYSGSDSSPTLLSEVNSHYTLTFALPTWGTGCDNPVSFALYSVDSNGEHSVTLTNNVTGWIDIPMTGAVKHHYKLKLYWNMEHNDSTCYAGKSGSVGISANICQKDV